MSGAEFLELAEQTIGSAFYTSFIGCTFDRAYLVAKSVASSTLGGRETVYSCALSDLPQEIATRIRAGENPWSLRIDPDYAR